MARLEARNLVKAFKRRTVVKNVSFSVHSGEIVGLLGRNGAGKSTSFNMAVGFLRPNSGMVILNGEDVTRRPMYKRARAGLGYLPQRPTIFAGLSVEENIVAVLELSRGRREALFRAEVLMEEFGIEPLRKQKAGSLSGGERRRLEIARALATEPALMLLDEPVYGVDPIAKSEILGLVQNLKQRGIGILITEHDVDAVLPLLDRCYIIHDGVVIFQGTPEEVVADERVREEYLGRDYVYRPQRMTAAGGGRRARAAAAAMMTSERLPQISLDQNDLGGPLDAVDLPELGSPGAEPDAVFEEVRSRVQEAARRTSLLDAEKTRAEVDAAALSAAGSGRQRRVPRDDDDVVTAEPAAAARTSPAGDDPFKVGPPTARSSPDVTGRSRLLPAQDVSGLSGSPVRAARPPARSLVDGLSRAPSRPGERKVHTRVVTKAEALRRKTAIMTAPKPAAPEQPPEKGGGDRASIPPALPGDVIDPLAHAPLAGQPPPTQAVASTPPTAPGIPPQTTPEVPPGTDMANGHESAAEVTDPLAAAEATLGDPLGAAEAAMSHAAPPSESPRPKAEPTFLGDGPASEADESDDAPAPRPVSRHRTESDLRRYGTSPVQLSKDLPLDPVALSPGRKAELAPDYSAPGAEDSPTEEGATTPDGDDRQAGEESGPHIGDPSPPFVAPAPDDPPPAGPDAAGSEPIAPEDEP